MNLNRMEVKRFFMAHAVNFSLIISFFLNLQNIAAQNNYAAYVNPFIGTGGHGHTFPGAVLPFGMVQLCPDTRVDGSWDGCSGYHYSDSVIYGFSHTHLSGTGCSDWGDIMLMPSSKINAVNKENYKSTFSNSNEKASAAYYQVYLKKPKVNVELTVTPRVGIHRYAFPKETDATVVLDLLHRDQALETEISIVDSVTIIGHRLSKAWAKSQYVYFVIKLSKPFRQLSGAKGTAVKYKQPFPDGQTGLVMSFGKLTEPLLVKVALSPVSFNGAIKNLNAEAPHWDFEMYRNSADAVWNRQLRKVDIETSDKNKLSVFYTAMYHCFTHPSLNMDVDNQYRGRDNKIYTAQGFTNYTVFSLWDTYRALHPLLTLLEPSRTNDFINSFLYQYKHSGRLPVWELSSNETDCMIGFHSVSVITDAMVKGIKGFDTLAIYEAMKAASNYSAFSIPVFNKQGYLRVDDENESVSKTLEYGYDNWCIAQAARLMGNKADETLYLKRSLAYKNLFDAKTGHMRPRKNGGWLIPFYANEINNHFTEGNSWHYTFYVPHDLNGLIKLYGGNEKFEAKLDELFSTSDKTRGREQADVTGLIGQYAHGNEPSHHMTYLYNYIGKPQKTIQRVHQICRDFYKNSPDGLIGNEDCGQMSAWYVFSAMGFYPVCPGSPNYALSEPEFDRIKINLENGKMVHIAANPLSGKPINAIQLNGSKEKRSFISHQEMVAGLQLNFENETQSGQINDYGLDKLNCPETKVDGLDVIPAPIVSTAKQVFKDSLNVEIELINAPVSMLCLYTIDGTEPVVGSQVYTRPFKIDSACTIKAKAFSNEESSLVSQASFYKLTNDYELKINSTLNPQYMAEGSQTLFDGIKGDTDWRKGNWLGCQGQDFNCVLDLKKQKELAYLGLWCLQDTPSWIVYPTSVEFFGSNDNINFTAIQTVLNKEEVRQENATTTLFAAKLPTKVNYRYVKLVAKNYGKLPAWHPGAGGEAFIFAGELEIK